MGLISGFLLAGGLMTIVGLLLIYVSLRAGPNEISKKDDVYYFGPLPIMVKGMRIWIITAMGVTSVILAWITYTTLNISFFGWV